MGVILFIIEEVMMIWNLVIFLMFVVFSLIVFGIDVYIIVVSDFG